MALAHASPGQALDVRPLGPRLADAKTLALFKSEDLEILRLVLLAGRSFPQHKVPGEVTIHCLEGSLDIQLEARSVRLEAGALLFLTRHTVHAVHAVTDASALVTICLKP